MSSRRPSKQNEGKLTALQLLKQRRQEGIKGISNYELQEEAVYDEVDEEEYQNIVRKRLNEDFVVDDDGLGYVDYGVDDWGEQQQYSSDEEQEEKKKKKEEKKKSKHGQNLSLLWQQQMKNKAKAGNIVGPFQQKQLSKMEIKRDAKEEEEEDLEALLGQVDEVLKEKKMNKGKKKSMVDLAKFERNKKPKLAVQDLLEKEISEFDEPITQSKEEDDNIFMNESGGGGDDFVDPMYTKEEKEEINKPQVEKEEEEEEIMDTLKVVQKKAQKKTEPKKPVVPQKPVAPPPPQAPLPALTNMKQPELNSSPTVSAYHFQNQEELRKSVLSPQQTLLMYWLDAYEGKDGLVYLFGKVFHPMSNQFLSCCLSIHHIERSVYFLPRPYLRDSNGMDTEEVVDLKGVWTELDQLMQRTRVSKWGMRQVKKKYAFEVPDVPVEADWVEVNYSFKDYPLTQQSGKTFSHVFGTHSSALELFLLRCNLMGPCWLEIRNVRSSSTNVSWCKLEYDLDFDYHPDSSNGSSSSSTCSIRPLLDSDLDGNKYPEYCKKSPPIVVMSLALKTVVNYQKQQNEILMCSGRIYTRVQLDTQTTEEEQKYSHSFTAVRPLTTVGFPLGFQDLLKRKSIKCEIVRTEKALLNYLMAVVSMYDPDIVCGHNFLGFDLDILLQRMKEWRVESWSKLGRLRRTQFPRLTDSGSGGAGGGGGYAERLVMSGRIVCDSYLAARELIKSKSYSLTHLSKHCLNQERMDIPHDQLPLYFNHADDLLWLLMHCQNDSYLCVKLVFQLMVLPLYKQLTCLSGNLLSRTFVGGRAERNEFLLMHEFFRGGYICPDKHTLQKVVTSSTAVSTSKKSKTKQSVITTTTSTVEEYEQEEEEEEERVVQTRSRRKPAYAGGLVLEPKKGLYDKYILMLDFNSLYPSIIQEYNICFTTVSRLSEGGDGVEEEMPSLPDPGLEEGILPRLLKQLVQRRRQVKQLMKHNTTNQGEYEQLNIRQQALKLTANSMYGCLGFTHSRFYCKPLAMLITQRGREILQDTVQLAEELGLEVVYGDTDSIMIYTASTDLNEVKQIGLRLKQAVNRKYRLLEIEMDGFYKRMLLLKKKKYAALSVVEKDGRLVEEREIKGLDLVRRDWCLLSHDCSDYVLNQILSDLDRDDVLNNVHSYLEQVGNRVREGQVEVEKYVIRKTLMKMPEQYHDSKQQPHVQVAMRMKQRGEQVRVGDTIEFIICTSLQPLTGQEDTGTTTGYAQRAASLEEVKKYQLEVDREYYLQNQVHPPISRILSPIDGTDEIRLAMCLGLDPGKYRKYLREEEGDEMRISSLMVSDQERFRDCERLLIQCQECGSECVIDEVVCKKNEKWITSLHCHSCLTIFNPVLVLNQILLRLRHYIKEYGQKWMRCDDQSCLFKTRQLHVYNKCPQKGCRGLLKPMYTDLLLYTQLLYYRACFDTVRYIGRMTKDSGYMKEEKVEVETVLRRVEGEMRMVKEGVERVLERDARGYVHLGRVFQFHVGVKG